LPRNIQLFYKKYKNSQEKVYYKQITSKESKLLNLLIFKENEARENYNKH